MNKTKPYMYPSLIFLGILVLSTFVTAEFRMIMASVLYFTFSVMIFSVVLTSKKYILNKGLVFIGMSYLFVAVFIFLGLFGRLVALEAQSEAFDFEQFVFVARLFEIVIVLIGLSNLFDAPKINTKKFMYIESGIVVLIISVLLMFNIFPTDNDVLAANIKNVVNALSIVFYVFIILIAFISRVKLGKVTDILYLMFGLFAISDVLVLFELNIEILDGLLHITRIGGLFVFLYFIYLEGIKIPFEISCKEIEDSRDKLLELSRIDELTMIANRRFLFENLEKSFRLAKRENHQIGFLMIDIDDFKHYNDTFGHLHGDSILRRVAKAIEQSSKRPLDFAGRYGGEEFLVVLPNSDFDGAIVVCKRILQNIHDLRINHYSKPERFLTVSIGFSIDKPTRNDTIDEAIAVADEYLYKVKGTGKNSYMGTEIKKQEKE